MKKKATRAKPPVTLYQGKFLEIKKQGTWEYAARVNATDVTCIVPQLSTGEFVLIEQFRPPLKANVIEWPAGLVGDEPGMEEEPLLCSAQRELEEETGLASRFWTTAGEYASSAGLTNETVHFFLAQLCQKVSQGGGVAGEQIQVHHVPQDQLTRWLMEQVTNGKMIDAKVATGCWLWNQLIGE